MDERNRVNVSILFGDLIERDLFSYDKYIQRIIARGEVGLSMNEVCPSYKIELNLCAYPHI